MVFPGDRLPRPTECYMPSQIHKYHLDLAATQELLAWAQSIRAQASSPFAAARQLATRLGVQWENDRAIAGFWVPDLTTGQITADRIWLEVLTPLAEIDFQADHQQMTFQRQHLQLMADGAYLWGVLSGLQPGSRQRAGVFYWLKYLDQDQHWQTIFDPLACSLPFGAFSPAELYDLKTAQAQREDQDHFRHLEMHPDPDGIGRIQPPTNILQIHINTATAQGSLASLANCYASIAEKVRRGEALSPAEQNYTGYDAIQLMPIEPIIEYEAGPPFLQIQTKDPLASQFEANLQRPDMTNWGYDVVLLASSATNPAVLASRRPDELIDLIATLHNFPGKPIQVIFDIVYGHTDNQALSIMQPQFLAGPGMYGQTINFKDATVRAILLEMQRRKHNYGVDGVRVDGAQDFKNWNPETRQMEHDDDYLELMNDVVQEVAGVRYRPWMIFEDGRPWPRADWELASTYREVTRRLPNVWQWGSLTFAHNTPFLFTFWISKWWRIREIAQVGSQWITGCANHDTLRRGSQVDINARLNTYLGNNLPEIFFNAYDNPAAKLFDYAMMPGVPMDFINASMRAPWSFIRNTDDRYGVKVLSEEARFLDWAMDEAAFQQPEVFKRLKELGFNHLKELRRFMNWLDHLMQASAYQLETVSGQLQSVQPSLAGPELTPAALKKIARAWMDDVHDYCNVSRYYQQQDPARSNFNYQVRAFRRERPWLRENLGYNDYFDHLQPCDGSVVFYGLRWQPGGREQVLFVANMEGAPVTLTPAGLPIPNLAQSGWKVALSSPGLPAASANQALDLANGQAVVFTRQTINPV